MYEVEPVIVMVESVVRCCDAAQIQAANEVCIPEFAYKKKHKNEP